MNTVVVEVRIAADGKRYPPTWVLPEAERARAASLAHALIHRDGLSLRKAQKIMLEQYALRRSTGSIHRDLTRYTCQVCRGE